MASELEELCGRLLAVCNLIDSHSGELVELTQRLNRTSQELNKLVGGGGAGVTRAVAGVVAATHNALAATRSPVEGSGEGRQHVERTVGAGESAASGSGGAQLGLAACGGAPTLDEIASWLPEIKSGYTGDAFDPRAVTCGNCGNCAVAVWQRLGGDVTAVAGLGTLTTPEMESARGRPQVSMSPGAIHDLLVSQGPGAHTVGIDRPLGAGHWFNAYYDGQKVVAIDGQSGRSTAGRPITGGQ